MAACWDQAHLDSDGRPARDARGGAITVCMFKLTRLAKQPALPCTAGRRLSLPFKHAVVTAAGRELGRTAGRSSRGTCSGGTAARSVRLGGTTGTHS